MEHRTECQKRWPTPNLCDELGTHLHQLVHSLVTLHCHTNSRLGPIIAAAAAAVPTFTTISDRARSLTPTLTSTPPTDQLLLQIQTTDIISITLATLTDMAATTATYLPPGLRGSRLLQTPPRP
mmetsp:Transcript_79568/g.174503  ORF Transcript_79568/g.174503 Transcript_79568/m.174503 type:complete len:124 (-) Transcript_79568:1822-2193(-)